MSDHFISHREHAVLMAAKRRSAKHYKWLLVAVPTAGAALLYWLGGAPVFGDPPPSQIGLFRNSQGVLCSKTLTNACVYPSGEVNIPSGPASVTVRAYFDLRPNIPGAADLSAYAAFGIDRSPIQTNEVKGMLSDADTLTAMLDGTALAWREVSEDAWLVSDRAKIEGAQEHERRSL